jgi:hypothetical protein
MVFRGFSWLSFWVLLFKNVLIIFVAVETMQKLFIFNVKVPNALLCHSKTYCKASNNLGLQGSQSEQQNARGLKLFISLLRNVILLKKFTKKHKHN